jgi:hypothetical protein
MKTTFLFFLIFTVILIPLLLKILFKETVLDPLQKDALFLRESLYPIINKKLPNNENICLKFT